MSEVFHMRAKPPTMSGGQVYKNPRFFSGPVEGATKAIVDPGFPEIEEAYKAAKVPVVIAGSAEATAGQRRTRGQAPA